MSDENTQRFIENARENLGIDIVVSVDGEEIMSASTHDFEGAEETLGKLERSLDNILLEHYARN